MTPSETMRRWVNPFELDGRWYKAALHVHTTLSDSKVSPADRIEQYRAAGYDIVVLTDHRKTHEPAAITSVEELLVVSGAELHPPCTEAMPYHLVGVNLPHGEAWDDDETPANEVIERVNRAGGAVIFAHPHWSGQSVIEVRKLKGLAAMEIYNTSCRDCGRPNSEPVWSYGLENGPALVGVAVDDIHGEEGCPDFNGGWTMLKLRERTAAGLVEAIRTGACYASCGPVIEDFRIENGEVKLKSSPVQRMHLISTPGRGARLEAEQGETVQEFFRPISEEWPWVRALVVDEKGRRAWTQPIVLK